MNINTSRKSDATPVRRARRRPMILSSRALTAAERRDMAHLIGLSGMTPFVR
ncbi:hypothetical protein ACGIF2_11035 [Cellulomonas sp. P22]|uniref:hypothetical protein n=1 Tax=Cellulomonas sp. P22 TaxID=3373189 RepID=UPI00379FBEBE